LIDLEMWNFANSIFSSSQYVPHGHCYLWQTPLVALHVVSNALIAIAYFSIPTLLIYFVKKRRDVPFSNIFVLFGAFIILCGAGHLLDIWTLWHPDYWLSGLEHAATAFVSCVTALQMMTLLPQFLALKTPEQLEAINRELQQEILERQRIEEERNRAYAELEFRVQERTADLKQANVALRESEARFQRLTANVPGMLYKLQVDTDGSSSLLYISNGCRKLYELEPEAMGTGYFEAIHPDDRQQRQDLLAQSAKTLERFEHEWRIILPSGAVKWIQTISSPRRESNCSIVWSGFQMDISDRHKAEEALRRSEAELKEKAEELEQTLRRLRLTQAQMIQSEKMSSLGQLVAGIAHEINNPVNFIHGNLSPIREYMQDLLHLLELYQTQMFQPYSKIKSFIEEIDLEFLKQDLPKILDSMEVGTDRIREIVLSLRNFSRLDEAEIKAVDLHQGIDNTLTILGNRLKARADRSEIQIVKQYGDLPLVECYAGQLNQVFMNILNNAIDAVEERIQKPSEEAMQNGEHPQFFTPTIVINTQLINAEQVAIQITDNGLGIPVSDQQRIFDPFFTTKPVGKGTGMGLSISYQIVTEKHQGTLQCISEPGQGSTFIVTILTRRV
jgi:PAS domain S-box-containing protein